MKCRTRTTQRRAFRVALVFFIGKSAQNQYRYTAPYKANPLPENPDAASSSGAPAQKETRDSQLPSARLHRSGQPSHRGWCGTMVRACSKTRRALRAAIYKKVRSLTPGFRKNSFSCFLPHCPIPSLLSRMGQWGKFAPDLANSLSLTQAHFLGLYSKPGKLWGQITHIRKNSIFVDICTPFPRQGGPPEKNTTWNPA